MKTIWIIHALGFIFSWPLMILTTTAHFLWTFTTIVCWHTPIAVFKFIRLPFRVIFRALRSAK